MIAAAFARQTPRLVYSTRWDDEDEVAQRGQADRSDKPAVVQIVIKIENDERFKALSKRQSLFSFLRTEARPSC